MKKTSLPYTLYGGVPGALSIFGLGFCLAFEIVLGYFTGMEVSLGLWAIAAAFGAFSLFVGIQLLRIRVTITDSELILNQLKSANFFAETNPVFVSWDSIKNIDVNIRDVKQTSGYGPDHIAMLQITSVGHDKPLNINATLYKSGDGLNVL